MSDLDSVVDIAAGVRSGRVRARDVLEESIDAVVLQVEITGYRMECHAGGITQTRCNL